MKKLRHLSKVVFLALLIVPATSQMIMACTVISEALGVSICTEDSGWQLRDRSASGYTFYHAERDVAASLRIYDGGENDGLTAESAANVIAASDGRETEDFAFFSFGQMPSGNFVYTATGTVLGLSFVYVNTISVGSEETLRIQTWRRGTQLSDTDREVHLEFGRLLRN